MTSITTTALKNFLAKIPHPLKVKKFKRNESCAQEAVNYFRKSVKITKYFGVLPYFWNNETQTIEYSATRFKFFLLVFFVYLTYELYIICQLIHASVFDEGATSNLKGTLQYITVSYGIPILLHSCTLFNANNLHNFINRLLNYSNRNSKQRLLQDKERKFGTVMRTVSFVAILVISLNLTSIFRRPESPHLLTSWVPKAFRKWSLIPLALVHGFIWCTQWASIYFYATFFMSYVCCMRNSLNRTREHSSPSSEHFYTETRKLELLQSNFNALMRWILCVGQIFLMTMCVFGFCGSILGEGPQAARLFVVSIFVLSLLINIWGGLGAIFETSTQVLAQWKSKVGSSLLFRMRFKSIRPIRVEIGGYFFVDGAMTLTILGIISENTFNVLLAA